MTNDKSAEEIVRGLRDAAENCCGRKSICVTSADLIESQAAEIAELRALIFEVTQKYETSVKMHGLTTELLNASQQETRAAVECIQDVETYLELGSAKYIRKTIDGWRAVPAVGGETE